MSTQAKATSGRGAATGPVGPVASRAAVKYLRSSAQKTRLVADQIRGKRVDEARAVLRHSRKAVAPQLLKLLMSAVANTENQGQSVGLVDTDQLVVRRLVVDEGPSAKRIQPAPMGRAFRIIKRTCHVTIEIGTREGKRE